jgi:hypothetical protein
MYRFLFALFAIVALATGAGTIATGQAIPPKPIHLPMVRFDRTPTPPFPTAPATATPTATEMLVLPTSTPPPTETPVLLFNVGEVVSCEPNAGVTYVNGTTRQQGEPVSGYLVAFSYAPDGPIVAQIQSGPHEGYPGWRQGFYSHILQADGPREGDWYFWIVDAFGQRISVSVFLHTDGQADSGSCQQAVIDFDSQ